MYSLSRLLGPSGFKNVQMKVSRSWRHDVPVNSDTAF